MLTAVLRVHFWVQTDYKNGKLRPEGRSFPFFCIGCVWSGDCFGAVLCGEELVAALVEEHGEEEQGHECEHEQPCRCQNSAGDVAGCRAGGVAPTLALADDGCGGHRSVAVVGDFAGLLLRDGC